MFDIEKANADMERIKARLKEARYHLAHLTEYGIDYLEGLVKKLAPDWKRKTRISSFDKVDAKEVAKRDIALRYDSQTGYLGTSVSGGELQFDVSPFDKVLIVRRSGIYSVVPVPEKLFVDKGMLYCAIADKDALVNVVFSLVYLDPKNGSAYIKRCTIEAWIMNKDYQLAPEGAQLLFFTSEPKKAFIVTYAPKSRFKINVERFRVESFLVKGLKALGVRISTRQALKAGPEGGGELFDEPSPSVERQVPKAKKGKVASKAAAVAKKATASKSSAVKKAPAAKKASPKPKAEPKEPVKGTPKGGLLDKASAKKKPPKR